MGFLGAVDLPARSVDDFRETLRDREAKLAAAKVQHGEVLDNIRKANAAVDAGDKLARNALPALNKASAVAGRLVLSIEREVAEARKRVDMAQAQVDAMALKQAQSDAAAVMGDRLFEVETPDGRRVRHRYASADGLQKMLQPNYEVVAEVFGAGIDGKGGLVEPLGQSTMKTLLTVHGDELLAFLAERGIKAA
jgi:hypothetical protein